MSWTDVTTSMRKFFNHIWYHRRMFGDLTPSLLILICYDVWINILICLAQNHLKISYFWLLLLSLPINQVYVLNKKLFLPLYIYFWNLYNFLWNIFRLVFNFIFFCEFHKSKLFFDLKNNNLWKVEFLHFIFFHFAYSILYAYSLLKSK